MWQLGLCCFLFEFASRKRLGLYLRSKSENLFGAHGDVSNHLTYMGAWRALLLMFASKCQFQGRHKNKPSEILFLIWVEISFTDRGFRKMGECREVLGGGPAPPSKLQTLRVQPGSQT
jgi:hypothetical protein